MHQKWITMNKINNDSLRMNNAIGNIERSMQEAKNVEGESIEDTKSDTVISLTSAEKKRKWGVIPAIRDISTPTLGGFRVGVKVNGVKVKVIPKDQEKSDEDSKPAALKKRETTWGVPARKANSTLTCGVPANSTWGVPAQHSPAVSKGRKSTWGVPAQYGKYSKEAIEKASKAVLRDYNQELNDEKLKAKKQRKH